MQRQLWRHCALWSYLGLLGWILLWQAWLAPSASLPVAAVLIVLLAPLLPSLRGMLHGRRNSHRWMSMLSMLYFVLGVADAYADPARRIYGAGLLVLSLLLFVGSVWFVRSLSPSDHPA